MTDVMEEYQASLADLTFNSKPHINMLTILAEENKIHAENIVSLIEAQIAKAKEKLPLLYLLDSIIKNVGENYKPLFARNLTSIFKLSFQTADDKAKMSLFKLRLTWDNYFPLKKLYNLDTAIKELDANWPVKPLPAHLIDSATTTIHVNPKFIKKNESGSTNNRIKHGRSKMNKQQTADVDTIRQQLMRQQKELLDLQQKKLILELEQTKQQLAAKQREVEHDSAKPYEKIAADSSKPTAVTVPAGLRVTLANEKASSLKTSSSQVVPKDPRLKSSFVAVKKIKNNTPEVKAMPSVKVDDDTKQKRSIQSKSPSSPHPIPSKVPKLTGTSKQFPESKKKSKSVEDKPEQQKNQRILKLKNQRKDSKSPDIKKLKSGDSRIEKQRNTRVQVIKEQHGSSVRLNDTSMSPRFSPEPEIDDSRLMDLSPLPMPLNRRDSLKRRPSFDPDLHIPKELTLGHQNEILKQADHQLRSGQLTHRQHQEILKKLHQLFEVQRIRKVQDSDDLMDHGPDMKPIDPRQSRGSINQKLQSSKVVPPLRQPSERVIQRGGIYNRKMQPDEPPPVKGISNQRRTSPDYRMQGNSKQRRALPSNENMPIDSGRKIEQRSLNRQPPPPRHKLDSNQPRKLLQTNRLPHSKSDPRFSRKLLLNQISPSLSAQDKSSSNRDNLNVSVASMKQEKGFKIGDCDKVPPLKHHSDKPPPHVSSSNQHLSETDDIEPPPLPPAIFLQRNNSDPGELNKSFVHEDLENQKSLRQYAFNQQSKSKAEFQPAGSNLHQQQKPSRLEEKPGLEEPEDYIIAGMSKETELEKCLEEPEDYIIANMSQEKEEEKNSCEEPEDFIIAQIPPEAEAYHNHSMSLKQTSDSEKAYNDHLRKIKQSMYKKELIESHRKSSLSDSASAAEESSSEKISASEPVKKDEKEEMRSPVLPPKKRRYVDSDSVKTKDNDIRTTENETKPNTTKLVSDEGKASMDETSVSLKKNENSKDITLNTQVKTDKKVEAKIKSPHLSEKSANKERDDVVANEAKRYDKTTKGDSKSTKTLPEKEIKKTKKIAGTLTKIKDSRSKKPFERRPTLKNENKEKEKFGQSSENSSSVYVIEDDLLEELSSEKNKLPNKNKEAPRRPMKRQYPLPEEWHRKGMTFEAEEARIQRLVEVEQEKLQWEEKLTRELEMEQWKEDRIRRGHILRGRGRIRGRFPPPRRWESPPPDIREPQKFDIARGKILHKNISRPHPLRHEERPHLDHRPPALFPFEDNIRMRRPHNDRRRPPSPGMIHPPEWEIRRPRTPPGRRIPPSYHDHPNKRLPEWERPPPRIPPRETPINQDDRRRSPFESHPVPNQPPPPPPAINQLNVNKLLTDLVSMGIIPGNKKAEPERKSPVPSAQIVEVKVSPSDAPPISETSPPAPREDENKHSVSPFIEEDLMMLDPDSNIPEITLSSDLKVRHDEIIKRIYTGIQCSACGLRFTTRQTDLYADHLDWHYRINRKDKEGGTAVHRDLYPSAGEWICYEEIDTPQERAKNAFLGEADNTENVEKSDKDLTVPLTGKAGEDTCKVCKEAFETFYNENDDEWQFANCVKVDDDNFHPSCYGDHRDSIPPSTPLLSPTDGEATFEVKIEEVQESTTSTEDVPAEETEKSDNIVENVIVSDLPTTATSNPPASDISKEVLPKAEAVIIINTDDSSDSDTAGDIAESETLKSNSSQLTENDANLAQSSAATEITNCDQSVAEQDSVNLEIKPPLPTAADKQEISLPGEEEKTVVSEQSTSPPELFEESSKSAEYITVAKFD